MTITCSKSLNVHAGKAVDSQPDYTVRLAKRKLLKRPNTKCISISLGVGYDHLRGRKGTRRETGTLQWLSRY